jgi:hypothetical protein
MRAIDFLLPAVLIALSVPGDAVAATGSHPSVQQAATTQARPTIATLAIPGVPRFVAIARDVLLVQADYAPEFASQSGLVDDAIRVPSFEHEHVAALVRRLDADLAGLKALPWRRWPVDRQIDVRWIYANAERMRRELAVERLYERRPGAWLDSLAGNRIAIVTYAPARTDAVDAIAAKVPALVDEIDRLCRPKQADAEITLGVIDGIVAILKGRPGSEDGVAAL